jgi:methylenetetrahydrofolate dehydrogenase (NADP+) / methenyltetrahydrofolate cyclohydrolase
MPFQKNCAGMLQQRSRGLWRKATGLQVSPLCWWEKIRPARSMSATRASALLKPGCVPSSTLVKKLNADPDVDGILVQLPLPAHISADTVIEAIDPAKDVDGFHPVNAGRLATGQDALVPCTPLGALMLIKSVQPNLAGLNAVVVGRSNIVGKPMAQLLLGESCTVTIAHSRTRDLPEVCRRADILVAAVGRPEMIRGDWIKPGAIVIDVGINRVPSLKQDGSEPGKTRLVGDVNFAEASVIAGAITPVPGGVGPMTIACLLRNTLQAWCKRKGLGMGVI